MKKLFFLALFVIHLSANASENSAFTLGDTRPAKHVVLSVDQSRVLVLHGPVLRSNMEVLKNQLEIMAKISDHPAFLMIDSPGGEVSSGMLFVNSMVSIRREKGMRTYCIVEDRAYSMAAIISTFCYRTYMYRAATMLYHEMSYSVQGPATQTLSRAAAFTAFANELNNQIADALKMDRSLYFDLMRKELWLTSSEAVRQGVTDGTVDPIYYTAKAPEINFFDLLFGGGDTLWNSR